MVSTLKKFAFLFAALMALSVFPGRAVAQTYQTQCPQGSSVNSWGSARNGGTGAILQNYCTDSAGNAILNFSLPSGNPNPQRQVVGTFPGADTGAQINACDTFFTSHGLFGGECVLAGDLKPLGAPEISTPPALVNETTLTGCAVSILVDVSIHLSGYGQSVVGCPTRTLQFSKNANIDVFTVTSTANTLRDIDIAGGLDSGFTGNGVNVNGATQPVIDGISAGRDAGTEVLLQGGTTNALLTGLDVSGYGTHAVYCNSCSGELTSSNMSGWGDETSSTVLVTGSANFSVSNNFQIWNRHSFPAIDTTGAVGNETINGNIFVSSAGTAISASGGGTINDNIVGGATALSVSTGSGTASGNIFSGSGAGTDAVVLTGSNQFKFIGNDVSLTDSVGGACGVKITGDTIGVQLRAISVTINGSGTADYGGCIKTTSGHMLNIFVDGLVANGVGAPSGSAAWYTNNAGNVNTNWSVHVSRLGCTHLTDLLKRTDTQNNVSVYDVLSPGDCTLDAGTGSTADMFTLDTLTFAALPSPAGNGSIIRNCTNCSQAKPTTNAGAGAYVVREAGAWNGL